MTLTAQQRKERSKYIGGSDCAAIFGISKWSTPLDVFCTKIVEDEDYEPEPELTPADPAYWGNELELTVVRAFELATGKACEIVKDTLFHPEYPFIAANIDAKIKGENAILEVKTARYPAEWGECGSDQIPESYLLQCAHYSAVLNLDKVYIALLVSTNDFRIYEYVKNVKLEKLIIEKEKEFWYKFVLPKSPPQPINSADALKLYKNAVPDSSKVADREVESYINEIREAKQQIKALEEKCKSRSTDLFNFMKESETLVDESGNSLATWRQQTYNRFDSQIFKIEHSELYNKYIKQTNNRVLRLKGDR